MPPPLDPGLVTTGLYLQIFLWTRIYRIFYKKWHFL